MHVQAGLGIGCILACKFGHVKTKFEGFAEVCDCCQGGGNQRSATHCRDGGRKLPGCLPVLPIIVASGGVGVRVRDDVEEVGHGREAALVSRALKAGRKSVHLRGRAGMALEQKQPLEGHKNSVDQKTTRQGSQLWSSAGEGRSF